MGALFNMLYHLLFHSLILDCVWKATGSLHTLGKLQTTGNWHGRSEKVCLIMQCSCKRTQVVLEKTSTGNFLGIHCPVL